MTRMPDQLLPSRADLDASTGRTAAVMADPAASLSDRLLVAKAEEATHQAYLQRPGTDAELQAEAEMEGGRTAAATEVGSRWPEDKPVLYTLTDKAETLLAAANPERRTRRKPRTPQRS